MKDTHLAVDIVLMILSMKVLCEKDMSTMLPALSRPSTEAYLPYYYFNT